MSSLHDRIAQFRKMTTDDPENELGHFRLGQLLADDGQHAEALKSFEATIALSPNFSKVYQLMGDSLIALGQNEKAVEIMTTGYTIADQRGDKMPRDAMGAKLAKLGAPIPNQAKVEDVDDGGVDTGFRCGRPGCPEGKRALPIPIPPMEGALGERIKTEICLKCWNSWWKDFSIKVVNELRLDLSSESGQAEYDRHLKEFFGFEG